MNSKATRAALLTSITSLVLCFTMLMGTSLAWFVDRVENTNNRIEAGNLEVDLVMLKNGEYVSVPKTSDEDRDLFALATGSPVLWQPGESETLYLGIRNEGSLSLAYTASLVIDVEESDGVFRKNLQYEIIPLENAEDRVDSVSYATETKNLLDNVSYDIEEDRFYVAMGAGVLAASEQSGKDADETVGEAQYYAIVLRMGASVPEECMGKSVTVDIQVSATQLSKEQREDLYAAEEAENQETLSATSWKMKTELSDFSFLETEEDKESEYIFPEETVISDGETEYPLSTFSVASIGDAKLLIAEPLEETETEATSTGEETATDEESSDDTEEQNVFVYLQMPDDEETEERTEESTNTDGSSDVTTEQTTESTASGWYLVDYEELQKLLSSQEADITALFTSENIITAEEKLPIVTFPESEEAVLENKDFIKWLVSSADKTEIPLS